MTFIASSDGIDKNQIDFLVFLNQVVFPDYMVLDLTTSLIPAKNHGIIVDRILH